MTNSAGPGKAKPPLVAICGRPVSPGIYDTLMLVGRDELVARLDRWL